jgi:hypothetical protein
MQSWFAAPGPMLQLQPLPRGKEATLGKEVGGIAPNLPRSNAPHDLAAYG